jgi:hypothetical protein
MSVKEGCAMAARSGIKKICVRASISENSFGRIRKERALFPNVDSELASEDKFMKFNGGHLWINQ